MKIIKRTPLRVKKKKYKFTCIVSEEMYQRANKARTFLGMTWVEVVESAMGATIENANDQLKVEVVTRGKK